MEERRQRRTLAAHTDIISAEVPNHRSPQCLCQKATVAHLKRALQAWRMCHRLAVKSDQIHIQMILHHLDMRGLNHPCRSRYRIATPLAEGRSQHLTLRA